MLWLSGDKVILNHSVSQLKSLISILWSENIHNVIESSAIVIKWRIIVYVLKICLQWYLVYYFKILRYFNIIIIINFFNFSFANLVTFCVCLRIWECQFSEQDQHIITRMHECMVYLKWKLQEHMQYIWLLAKTLYIHIKMMYSIE